jgi:carotenoid cleavage dioxygenase-like enzyme
MSRNTASGVEKRIKDGQERSSTFGQDICQTVFAKTASTIKETPARPKGDGPSDTNVNVVVAVNYPGVNNPKVVTMLTDSNRIVDLDWKTLEPKELYNYSKFNPKFEGMLSAAHPCVDPNTNETWQFVTVMGQNPGYNVFTISDASPEGELVGFVPAKSAYIHSSFLTENYYVLCVPPVSGVHNRWQI